MTSNLKSAKQAIEAELSHARDGIAYYTARVEALENALQQLETVESAAGSASRTAKSAARANAPKEGAGRRGRKPRAAAGSDGASRKRGSGAARGAARDAKRRNARAANGSGLPTTGGDFWLKLIGPQPQSAVDISQAAASALGIESDQKEQIQKLKQRVSPALASLVSAHKIQDTGAGRARRFFKSGGQAVS